MTFRQWLHSRFSMSRSDDAAERVEYRRADPAIESLSHDGSVHPGSDPAEGAEGAIAEFDRPRDLAR
jgi:hypothetical protein